MFLSDKIAQSVQMADAKKFSESLKQRMVVLDCLDSLFGDLKKVQASSVIPATERVLAAYQQAANTHDLKESAFVIELVAACKTTLAQAEAPVESIMLAYLNEKFMCKLCDGSGVMLDDKGEHVCPSCNGEKYIVKQ